MPLLFYVRLFGFTAGAIVELFFIALILGHRRPRAFERVLFFLILALFAFYCGGLLVLNAGLHYAAPPAATTLFANGLMALGLALLPALVFHTHVEYFLLGEESAKKWLRIVAALSYLASLLVSLRLFPRLLASNSLEFFTAGNKSGSSYAICFGVALIASAVLDFQIAARPLAGFRNLFRFLGLFGATVGALTIYVYAIGGPPQPIWADGLALTILLSAIPVSAVLEYWILRHNFLEIGSQKNLVYALSAAFLALLYLTLVRRVSGWLEPVLPPEATASTLLFILVVLFEPLERGIGRAVQRTFKRRFDRLQRLLSELQEQARHGDVVEFAQFVEWRVKEELGLSVVRLTVLNGGEFEPLSSPGGLGHVASSRLVRNGEQIGVIEAASTGAVLTGEVTAALDFLAEQLPALIDLCRLIQDKVELERAFAERERMAMLGQMAASVSHNLRNPLSSMKTIVQLQLENRELPQAMREDLLLILSQVDRLDSKLTQLLRYSRSPVQAAGADETAAGGAVITEVVNVLRRDAEQRGVRVECATFGDATRVRGSEEALSDIFANLILNAVESQPAGGRIDIGAHRNNGCWIVEIRDAGPGISANVRERIFQPFFTTKANGTGLGLAIVTRRLGEIGGTIEIESPVSDERGTKFTVTLPLASS